MIERLCVPLRSSLVAAVPLAILPSCSEIVATQGRVMVGHRHECLMCGMPAETHLDNVRHMMTHVNSYRCMICGETFTRGPDLVRHDEEQHETPEEAEARRARVIEVDLVDSDQEESSMVSPAATNMVTIDLTASSDQDEASEVDVNAVLSSGGSPTAQVQHSHREMGGTAAADVSTVQPGSVVGLAGTRRTRARTPAPAPAPSAHPGPHPAAAPPRPPACSRPGPASRKSACRCSSCRVPTPKAGKENASSTAASRARRARSQRTRKAAAPGGAPAGNQAHVPDPSLAVSAAPEPVLGRPRGRLGSRPKPRSSAARKGKAASVARALASARECRRRPLAPRAATPAPGAASVATPATPLPPQDAAPGPGAHWIDDLASRYSLSTRFGPKCLFCGHQFRSYKDSHWHLLRHLLINPAKTCMVCGEKFDYKQSLASHKAEHEQKNYPTCKV